MVTTGEQLQMLSWVSEMQGVPHPTLELLTAMLAIRKVLAVAPPVADRNDNDVVLPEVEFSTWLVWRKVAAWTVTAPLPSTTNKNNVGMRCFIPVLLMYA